MNGACCRGVSDEILIGVLQKIFLKIFGKSAFDGWIRKR